MDALSRLHADSAPVDFELERFEYVPRDLRLLLSVRLSLRPPSPAHPLLWIAGESVGQGYMPLLSRTARATSERHSAPGGWIWRGVFAVPHELACDPRGSFALRIADWLPMELGRPSIPVAEPRQLELRGRTGRARPYAMRRGTLLFAVTCQLCLSAAPVLARLRDGYGRPAELHR